MDQPTNTGDVTTADPTTTDQAGADVTAATPTTLAPPTGLQADGQPLGTESDSAPNADNALSNPSNVVNADEHPAAAGADSYQAGPNPYANDETLQFQAPGSQPVTRAQVEAYLQTHPDEIGTLLADLDESDEQQAKEGQEAFITQYLKDNPQFADLLLASQYETYLKTQNSTASAPDTTQAPAVDTTPATASPVVTAPVEPAAPAVKTPKPFPATLNYERGDEVTVTLGNVKVQGKVAGIYFDGDGLTYQVEVHVADGVPMLGTAARTVKLDVPADLVSDAA